MPVRLSAISVAKAKHDPDRRIEISDVGTPGLRLVIQPSGVKSWAFRYESNGRSAKVTFGPATGTGALSLAEARNEANEARKLLAHGKDPAEHRRAARAAEVERIDAARREARRKDDLVESVLERFFADHVDGLKSAIEVKRLLNKEVKLAWKGRRIDQIVRADAIKLIDDIKSRGAATTANRTRANARAFFNWCIGKDLRETNPFDRTQPAKPEASRERILDDKEVRLLSLAIERLDWPWRQFFGLALLTGQRREEIAGMRWSELDLGGDEASWVLPSQRTKNGRKHVVPLSPLAVSFLDKTRSACRPEGESKPDFVFTTTGKTSISGFSRAKAKLDVTMLQIAREEAKARGDNAEAITVAAWHLHDLRRTVVSGMARLGISVAVAEKVVNHVSGTFRGVVGVYQRHDFLAEKRHALAVWADHVSSLTATGETNVVKLRKTTG